MSTHKSFVATAPGVYGETTSPTPKPGTGEVLVRVEYTALIPFDVEVAENNFLGPSAYPYVPGFTVVGTIAQLGEGVAEFKVGDRVAGYPIPRYGSTAKGAQEYAVLPAHAVGKVPEGIAPDDVATIPDNFVCAWWTLTEHLKLPLPSSNVASDASFLVYGASSSTGQFAVQLLAHARFPRIIAVSSRAHHGLLKSLGATQTVDYHDADWPAQVGKVDYALDIISTEASLRGVAQTVTGTSKVAILLPVKLGREKLVADKNEAGAGSKLVFELPAEKNTFPEGLKLEYVRTFEWDENEELKAHLMTKTFPKLLASGAIKPTPKKVIDTPNSLDARVKAGFDILRSNGASGLKVILKV
ncbi:GroES-like protein [Exidia glandulosa HHB12029]|uniref:GroES-like protein n=1 Tax=Exidia glandulosa HHB12029 TaxID=1314781 RepID=A0A165DSX5_EXIGL|nr:GroES-like protein [Exidia glandulosa HHB12029]